VFYGLVDGETVKVLGLNGSADPGIVERLLVRFNLMLVDWCARPV
jgi:hypothetical protein